MSGFAYSTPGLLFSAISLLMLTYTNRFLGLASVARYPGSCHRERSDNSLRKQVARLRTRIALLRHSQAQGVSSLIFCTASLFALALDREIAAQISFGAALLFMLISLGLSLREIHLSERAIRIELDDLLREPGS